MWYNDAHGLNRDVSQTWRRCSALVSLTDSLSLARINSSRSREIVSISLFLLCTQPNSSNHDTACNHVLSWSCCDMHQLYALGCIQLVSADSTEPTELGLRGTCLTVWLAQCNSTSAVYLSNSQSEVNGWEGYQSNVQHDDRQYVHHFTAQAQNSCHRYTGAPKGYCSMYSMWAVKGPIENGVSCNAPLVAFASVCWTWGQQGPERELQARAAVAMQFYNMPWFPMC